MRLRQEAIDKEKALVKYAREYIQMGDECLRVGMKDAAMRNYEKAVALCPKFKEAWTKIKKMKDAAMRNYEKAVALCPKFKEAWTKIKKLEKEIRKED